MSADAVLAPPPPFDFDLMAGSLAYFRSQSGADLVEDGVYYRVLEHREQPYLLSLASEGSVEAPRLRLTVYDDVDAATLDHAAATISWMLSFDLDLDGFYIAVADDPVLSQLTRLLRGLRPVRSPTVFEAVVMAVCSQQISGVVARRLRTRLVQSFGPKVVHDGRDYFAFPSPQRLAPAPIGELRSLGLSERKAEYILGLARAVADGSFDLEGLRGLSDEEARSRLLAVRGLGPWTVHWTLSRGLGRRDIFPGQDLALRRLVSRLYLGGERATDAAVAAVTQRWQGYRSLVTTYIFAALRLGIPI